MELNGAYYSAADTQVWTRCYSETQFLVLFAIKSQNITCVNSFSLYQTQSSRTYCIKFKHCLNPLCRYCPLRNSHSSLQRSCWIETWLEWACYFVSTLSVLSLRCEKNKSKEQKLLQNSSSLVHLIPVTLKYLIHEDSFAFCNSTFTLGNVSLFLLCKNGLLKGLVHLGSGNLNLLWR